MKKQDWKVSQSFTYGKGEKSKIWFTGKPHPGLGDNQDEHHVQASKPHAGNALAN